MNPVEIPLARPWMTAREEELVLEVVRSGRLSMGRMTTRFEELVAARVGSPHAAAVSSGTAGLHLCARLAGIEDGDEVITSPFSFVASANCFIYEGGVPVFTDIDADTWNFTPIDVENAITPRTRAIVATDIFGYPCDIPALREIADRRGVVLIEDACEALGARHRGVAVGGHGHLAVFAFYANKQVATGEGGMVTTSSETDLQRLRSLANQGRADSGGWLEHRDLGFNYRIDELSAALGVAQMERFDTIMERRQALAARYAELLAPVVGLRLPQADDIEHTRSWFVYVVRLPETVDRDRVIDHMARSGIQTSRYLPCIHLQPYMRARYGFSEGAHPVAESLSRATLALPFFPTMSAMEQERVAAALATAIAAAS